MSFFVFKSANQLVLFVFTVNKSTNPLALLSWLFSRVFVVLNISKFSSMSNKIHEHVSQYVDRHRREYITEDFAYSAYTPPHTMFDISNDLPAKLLDLSSSSIRLYLVLLSRLRRNVDVVKACTVVVKQSDLSSIMSRNTFYQSLKELIGARFVLKTKQRSTYIVNIQFANKLYKPKLDVV